MRSTSWVSANTRRNAPRAGWHTYAGQTHLVQLDIHALAAQLPRHEFLVKLRPLNRTVASQVVPHHAENDAQYQEGNVQALAKEAARESWAREVLHELGHVGFRRAGTRRTGSVWLC